MRGCSLVLIFGLKVDVKQTRRCRRDDSIKFKLLFLEANGMKRMAILGTLGILGLILTTALPVWAASANDAIVGEWRLERAGAPGEQAGGGAMRGGMMGSLLSLSVNKEGKLVGQMIGMMGVTDLSNLKFENGKLSFSQTTRRGDTEMVSQFSGTLKDGKMTVTQSSERGDVEMTGTRIPAAPEIVGNWEITTTRGEMQMVTILSVTTDKDGKIAATWTPQRGQGQFGQGPAGQGMGQRPAGQGQGQQGQQGQRPAREGQGQRPAGQGQGGQFAQGERPQGMRGFGELSDVAYKDGVLTFSRRMMGRGGQQQDQQQAQERVTSYTVTAKGDVLTGTVKNPQGEETPITGKRAAASPLAGKWLLTISSERGDRTQRLVVNPDMSGMFGTTPVEKITFEDNAVGFTTSMGFGDRTIENTFKGKLEGDKLVGQMSSTGFDGQATTQNVAGKKM